MTKFIRRKNARKSITFNKLILISINHSVFNEKYM